jgi:hypothetical protein
MGQGFEPGMGQGFGRHGGMGQGFGQNMNGYGQEMGQGMNGYGDGNMERFGQGGHRHRGGW